ncbi:DUF6708 domain-containing protein [Vulcaniibacterium tengchongense]|uniref:DUF6708 domain-containing protein n=1 Tax=Vulcaniibacterium tengchongense TaxID=1273429 RepID=A0A3N4VS30_9GAMM|nr:DUF6708 domain-containing protein [Vulcaniibacterium tengchongense]RPE75864.1 hypothetical protein EDC50_2761 [Vulcaniibacterium tengchongense]
MAKGESKRVPEHPHWYEDLPERDAPLDRAPKMVHGDVNAMDAICLEISRASTLMRGLGIAFGLVSVAGLIFFVVMICLVLFPLEPDLIVPLAISPLLAAMGVWIAFLLLKTDLSIPRDRPVRLNRTQRKVYVYEHAYGMNPFKKWPTTVKVFDWDTLQAELHRQAGFNGKAYIQRFSLWLVSCKPGTNEVVDRFELKGNHPTRAELYDAWAYCRTYMEHGPEGLPVYPPRRQEVTFRRSFFEYLRFLDPTEEGREERAQMTASEWILNSIVALLAFWLLFPMGIGHYIAMRFAPEVKWPPEIDAESRRGPSHRAEAASAIGG